VEAASGIAYSCGGLSIAFDHESAVLRAGEKRFQLKPAISASGTRYVGADNTEFWSKGDRAMLTLKGAEYPECIEKGAIADASGGEIFKARGNEPGWLLELGSLTYKFTGDYGEIVMGGATPAPEKLSDGVLYTVAGSNLSMRIYDRLCNDDATGAPFPKAVTVTLGEKSYMGCGGDSRGLLLGEWKVTHIAGAAAIPNSPATIGFNEQGLVFGNASCNRYSGGYELTGEGLRLTNLIATEMACLDEALMAQERNLLDQVMAADRFDFGEDGALVLYARDKEAIRARR
jgi:heat shock protein HslJ